MGRKENNQGNYLVWAEATEFHCLLGEIPHCTVRELLEYMMHSDRVMQNGMSDQNSKCWFWTIAVWLQWYEANILQLRNNIGVSMHCSCSRYCRYHLTWIHKTVHFKGRQLPTVIQWRIVPQRHWKPSSLYTVPQWSIKNKSSMVTRSDHRPWPQSASGKRSDLIRIYSNSKFLSWR